MRFFLNISLIISIFSSSFLFANKNTKPRISLNANDTTSGGYTFLAKSNPVIRLGYKNINKLNFELFKIKNSKDLNKLVKEKRYFNDFIFLKIYKNKTIKKTLIRKWSRIFKKDSQYQLKTFKLNKLKPGVYILYAKTNKNIESATIINITENVLIIKRVKSKLLLYSSNVITGKAIKDADVYLSVNKIDNKTGKYDSMSKTGKTDENGVFTLFDEDFIKNEDITLDFSIIVKKKNNNAILYSYGSTGYLSSYVYNSSFIYTDKIVYTRDEKVFYKLILRAKKDYEYFIPTEKFKVIVEDSNRKKIIEKYVSINKIGTFSDSFKLNKDFSLGSYSISLINSKGTSVGQSYSYFRVLEYEEPKAKTVIKTNKNLNKITKKNKERNNPKFSSSKNIKENSITLDKNLYMPNEKAKVLIKIEKPNSYALVTLETKDTFIYKLEYIKGNSKIIEFDLNESMTPNALIKVGYFNYLTYNEQEKEIMVYPIHKLLTITLEKNKDVYKPNEEIDFKFKVTNHKGEAVENAELSLIIVDANVYKIQKDYSENIFKFYYLSKKVVSVKTSHSFFSPLDYESYKDNTNNKGVISGVGYVGGDDRNNKVISKPTATLKWIPNFTTNQNGEAIVKVKFPKDLTQWKIIVRGITSDLMVGELKSTIDIK